MRTTSAMLATLFAVVLTGTVLTGHAAAQTPLYSPPWLASTEGRSVSSFLGAWSDARYQFCDGDHRGKVAVIKEIAYRLDYRNYYTYYGIGRSWSNVKVQMADGDLSSFSNKFSTNFLRTPTQVFNASVAWPSQVGYPQSQPAAWGGRRGKLRFPLTASFLTIGQKDIITDYTFTGGKLANGATWWTGTRSLVYYLDSWYYNPSTYYRGTISYEPRSRLHNNTPGVTGRCNDSAHGSLNYGSYLYTVAGAYGPWYATVQYRKKLVMYTYSYYTAPDAPVIHMYGINKRSPGIDIGTGCNKLHIGQIVMMQSFRVPPRSVSSNSFSGYSPFLIFPWTDNMRGYKVVTQAAWLDSKTRRLNLSQANEVTLPNVSFAHKAPRRACAYQYGTYGPYLSLTSYTNPAVRYAQ